MIEEHERFEEENDRARGEDREEEENNPQDGSFSSRSTVATAATAMHQARKPRRAGGVSFAAPRIMMFEK